MGLMSICPVCGSDWCTGAECVIIPRDEKIKVLERQLKKVHDKFKMERGRTNNHGY